MVIDRINFPLDKPAIGMDVPGGSGGRRKHRKAKSSKRRAKSKKSRR